MDYTQYQWLWIHTYTYTHIHTDEEASREPPDLKFNVCQNPTNILSLMKFEVGTHYSSDTNSLFCKPVSKDVCGFHGHREEAGEKGGRECKAIVRQQPMYIFMIVKMFSCVYFCVCVCVCVC